MPEHDPCTFTDAEGSPWRVRFGTWDLIEGFRQLDICLGDLNDPERINAGAFVGLVWYGCRREAKRRAVSKTEFHDKLLTPDRMLDGAAAAMAALQEALPGDEEADETTGTEASPETPLAEKPSPEG